MRIATWNVNGIRARATQFREWLERDRPDIVCLQELKAEANQIPEECKAPDYYALWHTRKGYSGVSLHVRKDLFAVDPLFSHPPFDFESRIVQADVGDLVIASVYVPNGGKDYAAKIDLVNRLIEWSHQQVREGRDVVVCGDMNIARAEMDVHPKERKPNAIGQRPEERALFATLLESPLGTTVAMYSPAQELCRCGVRSKRSKSWGIAGSTASSGRSAGTRRSRSPRWRSPSTRRSSAAI